MSVCSSFHEHRNSADYEYVSYVKITDVNVCPKIKKHELYSVSDRCESNLPCITIVESTGRNQRPLKKQTAQVNLRDSYKSSSLSASFSSSNSDEQDQDAHMSFQFVKTPRERRRACTKSTLLKPFKLQEEFSPVVNANKSCIIRAIYSDEELLNNLQYK
jgi:hypothetical protein